MSKPAREPESVKCPNCAEWISPEAILCRFCNSGLSPKYFRPCQFCAEMIRIEAIYCKNCRYNLTGEDAEPRRETSRLTEQLVEQRKKASDSEGSPKFQANLTLIRERAMVIIEQIRRELEISQLSQISDDTVRARIREIVNFDPAPLTMMEKGILLQNILDEMFGFGPLGPLLRDPSVQGIYVNYANSVYVERKGELVRTTETFESEQHLRQIIDKIIQPQHLNNDSHIVTCTLPSGTWVLAALRPGANEAPLLILRRKGC
jgi:hypothetical protein